MNILSMPTPVFIILITQVDIAYVVAMKLETLTSIVNAFCSLSASKVFAATIFPRHFDL